MTTTIALDLRTDFAYAGIHTPDEITNDEDARRWEIVEAHFTETAAAIGITVKHTRDEAEADRINRDLGDQRDAVYQAVHQASFGGDVDCAKVLTAPAE